MNHSITLSMSISQVTSEMEKEWIRGLQQGDEKALQSIFNQYYKYLLVSAYNIVGDNAKAKDLVQDVFFEIWKKRSQIDIQFSLKAYLRKAVVNRGLNYLKMHQRIDWGDDHFDTQAPDQTASPHTLVETSDLQTVINETINNLPPKCKTIFTLSRFEKIAHKEIAQQLDISTKTIENHITKALKLIRSAVDKYNELGIFILFSLFV